MKLGRLDDEFMRLERRLRRAERVKHAARFVGALRRQQRVWIEELPASPAQPATSASAVWCVDARGLALCDGAALAGRGNEES
ncbi:MAG: hypothetical protein M1482_04935 [Chloroflexi bacterium]|nr:hypothetical protein [Chloroflexota bacterium]